MEGEQVKTIAIAGQAGEYSAGMDPDIAKIAILISAQFYKKNLAN